MDSTTESVKNFAWQQMDYMWHNHFTFKTTGMVSFEYKEYCVVNTWMDEKTEKPVNPYKYYGKRRTEQLIKEATERIKVQENCELSRRK
jgi:hypothetical protein